ncbi:hypothetical protein Salat_1719400 [Sesamum alatum]|uniref:Small EDRK-rich factor-like N-terminal domain-containing protein n=1 Tax=Sesamum alatum TaxID=300844 RepID=A0AAE2CK89_9LAMI|nr:hypothetical protein Salat_1719400 [Sesamum alatum]
MVEPCSDKSEALSKNKKRSGYKRNSKFCRFGIQKLNTRANLINSGDQTGKDLDDMPPLVESFKRKIWAELQAVDQGGSWRRRVCRAAMFRGGKGDLGDQHTCSGGGGNRFGEQRPCSGGGGGGSECEKRFSSVYSTKTTSSTDPASFRHDSYPSIYKRDRERAQARNGGKGKGKDDGLTPEQRRERDAKALQEKAAKKAAQAGGGGDAGGKSTKK